MYRPAIFNSASAHPIRKGLWQAAIPLSAILLVMIGSDITVRLRDPSTKLLLGHDFLPSYSAGVVTREGRPRAMYDRDALSAVEFRIIREADLEISDRYGPYLNPPFYAWVFAPMSVLPYRQAALIFLIFNIVLLCITLAMLTRVLIANPNAAAMTQQPAWFSRLRLRGSTADLTAKPQAVQHSLTNKSHFDWRTTALVPLLTILPLPVWQAMGHQQNTFISLFLLTSAVICWRTSKPMLAGIIAGLLFFKPQLAAVFAVALVIGMGWRAFAGLAITGSVLLTITLLTLPGCLHDFLFRLGPILHWQQFECPYNWGRQVTFQSFWRLIVQGHVRGESVIWSKLLWWISSATVAGAIATAIWRFRTRFVNNPIARDRLIAATIVSMPVLMPYYMDYDLLLLALPAVLLAAEWIRHPAGMSRADRWLVAVWALFAVETHFNPGMAGHFRFNIAVPLLATLSGLHLWRCLRPESKSIVVEDQTSPPLLRAA